MIAQGKIRFGGLTKYWAIFQTQMTNKFAYPIDLLSRSLMIVMFMWIFAQLWQTTFKAGGSAVIAGYSLQNTMWYLLFAETIVLSQPALATTISQQIKDGSIAYLLGKPYNFILYQISFGLGDSVLQIASNLLAGGMVVWGLVGPPPGFNGWMLGLLSMSLGVLINLTINIFIGLLAFYTEDVTAFQWIYNKFVLILGGILIPIDFFPNWLKQIALLLPFSYTTYGPAKLFISPQTDLFVWVTSRQLTWIGLLAALVIYIYYKGSQRLVINGG